MIKIDFSYDLTHKPILKMIDTKEKYDAEQDYRKNNN